MRNSNKKVTEDDIEEPLKVSGSDIDNFSDGKHDLINDEPITGDPIETYNNDANTDTLSAMNFVAHECSANAKADSIDLDVTDIENINIGGTDIRHFNISADEHGYEVYQIDSFIYYMEDVNFKDIINNVEEEVPGFSIENFKHDYTNTSKPLKRYSVTDREDCKFIITSIVGSLTGKNYDSDSVINRNVSENCRIRKNTKLGTDGLVDKSIKYNDAKYGTPEENSFEQEVEDKQKKDGTVGALDQQQQQESTIGFVRKLPNVHTMNESIEAILESKDYSKIEYEPCDRVMVKIDKDWIKGSVTDVYSDVDDGQILVIMVQGRTFTVSSKEVKPDTDYLLNTRWGNVGHTDQDGYDAFDIDANTRLNNKVENDKYDYSKDYKDLNKWTAECDIVVNGFKMNYGKSKVSMKDVSESKKVLRVIDEDNNVNNWPADNINVEQKDWVWAVIVGNKNSSDEDKSDEPLLKVKIDPISFVKADDMEKVSCILNGKMTEIPKLNIKIIS
jgi:hypothetical protein